MFPAAVARRFGGHDAHRCNTFMCTLSFLLSAGAAAQYLEAVRPVPVEIDTRSPVRFEVRSSIGNKPVKGVVLQVFVLLACI